MTVLPEALASKVSKIVGQLGSDNPHIVTTAATMLRSTLAAGGCNISDLASHIAEGPREVVRYVERSNPRPFDAGGWHGAYHRPHPNAKHRSLVVRCQKAGEGRMSPWEANFLLSLSQQLARARSLSPKQCSVLADIAERMGVLS